MEDIRGRARGICHLAAGIISGLEFTLCSRDVLDASEEVS